MSSVQDAMKQRQGLRGAVRRRWHSPLFEEPVPLIGYVLTVLACYFGLTTWEAIRTSATARDITLFTVLMCCGAVCVEASRRLGQPSGVWRDLLSAWWLPVALLLPPFFALAAPAVLGLLIFIRVGQGGVYRRLFSSAALGLAGACASGLFQWLAAPAAVASTAAPARTGWLGGVTSWLTYPGPSAWLMHPRQAAIALFCAIVFGVLNTCLIAVAAWLADLDAQLVDMLWDRERILLDVTETCVGILVTIACALSALLLLVALPPVVLMQRSLLHSQLKAQARTDTKTGVLNAGAWQAEAAAAITRAQRRGEPLAVLLIDVDHFKKVNDEHGHLTGDALLRTLAAEMCQQVREGDLVGRFGGEEFVILLPATTATDACRVAERVRHGVGVVKVLTPKTIVGVTVSVGVAALGCPGEDLFELLAAADLALYRAKNTGRDRVCLYEPDDAAPGAADSAPGASHTAQDT